jgi:Fe2+ transport system protein B
MMEQMGKEQKVLITKQIRNQQVIEKRRQARLKKLTHQAIVGITIVIIIIFFMFTMMWVAYDRQQKYPQYGTGLIPKAEKQRKRESGQQVYIGR